MRDDEDGVCPFPAGADGPLKGGGGIFMAVRERAEVGDKDGCACLRRGFGSLRGEGFGSLRGEGIGSLRGMGMRVLRKQQED